MISRGDALTMQRQVMSVSEINGVARQLIERQLGAICVAGEVSGTRIDSSGHRWFCLKDRSSVLNAVMFRRDNMALGWACKDGDQVEARGRLTIYVANGRYQMVVQSLQPQGLGALQVAFERLKKKLQAEGLFAAERKRRLPLLPRCVAVLTSPTGAVIRDIVQVATRRTPNCHLLLVPVRVQGPSCASDLVAALTRLETLISQKAIDVVVVARGGGAYEELNGFNDEALARAIARCSVPVVSAVGHETDFTIADFVSDVRAPTPSAAAELIFAQRNELKRRLMHLAERAEVALRRRLQRQRLQLRALRGELGDGRRHIYVHTQRLALVHARLLHHAQTMVAPRRMRLHDLALRLSHGHPRARLLALRARRVAAHLAIAAHLHARVQAHRRRLEHLRVDPRHLQQQLQQRRQRLAALLARLQALSPLAVLQRGYGIVLDEHGQAVRRAEAVRPQQRLTLRVMAGEIVARVESAAATDAARHLTAGDPAP